MGLGPTEERGGGKRGWGEEKEKGGRGNTEQCFCFRIRNRNFTVYRNGGGWGVKFKKFLTIYENSFSLVKDKPPLPPSGKNPLILSFSIVSSNSFGHNVDLIFDL